MMDSHGQEGLAPAAPTDGRGIITVICGCMFSGKTTELLRRLTYYPSSKTLAVKHMIDTRYSTTEIVTHAGKAYPATVVAKAWDIPQLLAAGVVVVAIDEAHFFDESLVEVTLNLAQRGMDVILTSLDPDSWGRPFPIARRLRAVAHEPITKYATCARCGAQADHTQRRTPMVNGDLVGGPEHYEPRCRRCWSPPPEEPPDHPVAPPLTLGEHSPASCRLGVVNTPNPRSPASSPTRNDTKLEKAITQLR